MYANLVESGIKGLSFVKLPADQHVSPVCLCRGIRESRREPFRDDARVECGS
jgi:hypothetical protein